MSTCRGAACLFLALGVAGSGWLSAHQSRPAAPKGPGLGVPATPAQIAGADVSIPPDGSGLPPGSGTPAEGGAIYNAECVAGHGLNRTRTPPPPPPPPPTTPHNSTPPQ